MDEPAEEPDSDEGAIIGADVGSGGGGMGRVLELPLLLDGGGVGSSTIGETVGSSEGIPSRGEEECAGAGECAGVGEAAGGALIFFEPFAGLGLPALVFVCDSPATPFGFVCASAAPAVSPTMRQRAREL